MKTLILSGAGGSTNWLPLIFPLIALLAIGYGVDLFIKYVKRRKLLRENEMINDLNGHFEDLSGPVPNRN